jgi:phosphate transport system protein
VSQLFENQLALIREAILMMSSLTHRQFSLAIKALTERSDDDASRVIEVDGEVDDLEVAIDEMVITYMATHGPVATDCRFMITASKIANNLERIADEATTIARRVRELNREPLLKPLIDIPLMAEIAETMLNDCISSFVEKRVELAEGVIARDRRVDEINRQLSRELTSYMIENPKTITRSLNLMTIAKCIERIADHAQNIAEAVFYLWRGKDIRHSRIQSSHSIGGVA